MTRVAAAALCIFAGLYWLAAGSGAARAGGGGSRLLVGIFAFVWIAAATYPFVARRIGAAAPSLLPIIGLASRLSPPSVRGF